MCSLLVLGALLQELTVVGQIDAGTSPAGMAMLPAGDKLYVADEAEGRVHVLDLVVEQPSASISLGGGYGARGPVIAPGALRVWVQAPPSRVVGINAGTNTIDRQITVPFVPTNLAFTPSGAQVVMLVASSGTSNYLTRVDAATGSVLGATPLPPLLAVNGLAVTPDGSRALVTAGWPGTHKLIVVDLASWSIEALVPVSPVPVDVVLDASGTRALVVCWGGKSIDIVDLGVMAVVGSVPLGMNPFRARLSPDGQRAWVVGMNPGRLAAVQIDSALAEVFVDVPGAMIGRSDIAFRPDGRLAIVTGYGSGSLYLVHTDPLAAPYGTVASTLALGTGVSDVAFEPTGTYAYVAERTTGSVYVVYVSGGIHDLADAIESVLGELWVALSDPSLPNGEKKELQKAVDQLQGSGNGAANNGAMVKISNGQLEAGLAKVAQAIFHLKNVASIDTTPWQEALAEGARLDTYEWLLQAEGILGPSHPAMATAWGQYQDGVALQSQGKYREAVLAFKGAVRTTNDAL